MLRAVNCMNGAFSSHGDEEFSNFMKFALHLAGKNKTVLEVRLEFWALFVCTD